MAKAAEELKGSSSAKVHPSNDPDVDLTSYSLEKFRLYETRAVLSLSIFIDFTN